MFWLSLTIFYYLSVSFAIFYYLSVSFAIFRYLSLSFAIFHYLSLSFAIFRYLSLSFAIFRYLSLSFAIFRYLLTILRYLLLSLTIFYYLSLSFCYLSLYFTILYYLSLSFATFRYLLAIFHYLSLSLTIFHYVLLYFAIFYRVLLYFTILYYVLLCFAYYVLIKRQMLRPGDLALILTFCNRLINTVVQNPGFLDQLIVSAEVIFSVNSEINTRNVVTYSHYGNGHPLDHYVEFSRRNDQIMVWTDLTRPGVVLGSHVVHGNLDTQEYVRVIRHHVIQRDFQQHQINRYLMWWQKDGAPAHTHTLVMH